MFNLKDFRLARRLSQQQLADSMGMPIRTYEDLESGRTSLRPVHINAARYSAWKLRNPETVKGLPLQLFIVRFRQDGKWSFVWTVWAVDFAQAIDRFYNMGTVDLTTEVQIRLVGKEVSGIYGHDDQYADAVLEHREMIWPAEEL